MAQDILKYLKDTLESAGYTADIFYGFGLDKIIETQTNNLGKVYITYNSNEKEAPYIDGEYDFQSERVTIYYFAEKKETDSPLKKANELYMTINYKYADDTFGQRRVLCTAMRPIEEDTDYVIYELDVTGNNL